MAARKGAKKTVIITGGNKGIGKAIAHAFWKNGYHVLVGARSCMNRSNFDGKMRFKKLDVRNESEHIAVVKSAMKWTGRLDVFINCAGFSQWKAVKDVNDELWNSMIDTNLKGTFWGCKAAAANLVKGGCIINIASLAGKRGSANNSVYCASKFGVNGLTQALAKELGPRGIRVNAVCPVYVETNGLLEALKDNQSPCGGSDTSLYLESFADNNAALKRLPTAQEIAQTCLFLASPDASAITGQCINVDCGVLTQ
jgi:NAD(P)-dependent dehydrogenase (short-subunit alcohol dehydrogenase family)